MVRRISVHAPSTAKLSKLQFCHSSSRSFRFEAFDSLVKSFPITTRTRSNSNGWWWKGLIFCDQLINLQWLNVYALCLILCSVCGCDFTRKFRDQSFWCFLFTLLCVVLVWCLRLRFREKIQLNRAQPRHSSANKVKMPKLWAIMFKSI